MSADLVERLRLASHAQEMTSVWTLTVVRCSLVIEAADEIERLRSDFAAASSEATRLRKRAEALQRRCDYLVRDTPYWQVYR